jgi:hypothetical protein
VSVLRPPTNQGTHLKLKDALHARDRECVRAQRLDRLHGMSLVARLLQGGMSRV